MKRLHTTRNFFTCIIIFAVIIFITGCSKNGGSNPTPKASVTITSLNVTQGSFDTQVSITGTGLDPDEDQVFFNGKRATIATSGPPTRLTVLVPLAAGTGSVTVMANGVAVTGPVFTYVPALVVSTLAGGLGQQGNTDGTGSAAKFNGLSGLAIDKSGNLYATDIYNYNIRKITPQGIVTTVAGTGKQGNNDGPVSTATFQGPANLALDQQGNIYIADAGSLREITTTGNVVTISLKFSSTITVQAVTVDASNNLYILDLNNEGSLVGKVASDGTVTEIAGGHFTGPYNLIADKNGNLFVADNDINWEIAATSYTISKFAAQSGGIWEGLAFDPQGNLFAADFLDKIINKITTSGSISIYAGTSDPGSIFDGVANSAAFSAPNGLAVDASGNVFVADASSIREISFQ